MPQGVTYEQLSKTAKKRIEFCDSIIKAYEADKREKEAANNPQPVVENNNIIQDDFQNQLQNDIAPKHVKVINKVEDKKAKNEEKDPPDNDDLEPIRRCGYGVAVSNALDCVKAVADEVAESNDEDGVARTLARLWTRS